ncbi:MAG: hypothetical protein JNG84_09325 [Archangium sp.]|nr:hypothetical protein [Archangium sp.]
MKDASGATAPRGLYEVNNYAEEVTVTFSPTGRIQSSTVTWSSEPDYLVKSRYAARSTIMELDAGGKVMLGRWG